MNTTSKVALGLFGVGAFATIAAALALPSWIRGQAQAAIAQVQDELGLDIEVGDVSASIFTDFPRATVSLTDLHIRNRAPFDGIEIFRAGGLEVVVDVWSLNTSAPHVRGLRLEDASIDLVVRDGRSNWDVGGGSESDSESAPYRVDLDDVQLDRVDFSYRDADGVRLRMAGLSSRTKGSVASDAIALTTATTGTITVGTGDTLWLDTVALSVDGPMAYGTDTGRIGLDGLSLTLGALPLALNGSAVPAGDGWDVDMAVGAPKADFASVLSLLPAGTLPKGVAAAGAFAFDGVFKGHYGADTYPGGTLDLNVSNASLSSGHDRISDLGFVAHVERKEGPLDATAIDLSKAHMVVADSPIDFAVSLAPPLSDPFVDLKADGRLDLGAVDRAAGGGLGVDGKLNLDVALKGKASQFSDDAPGSATGRVRGKGIRMPLSAFPDPLQIDDLDLGFGPTRIDVNALSVRTGPTDAVVTGTLTNAVAYGLGQAPLGGRLAVKSKTIDLRTPADGAPSSDAATVVTVPTDLDLDLDLDLQQVYQGDYHLENVRGGVGVHRGTLTLDRIAFRTLGGTVKLDGTYAAPTADGADVAMDLAFENLAMDELMTTMDTAKDAIPAAARAGGRLGGQTSVRTRLLADTSPDVASLFSEGLVLTIGSSVAPNPLKQLADKLGDPRIADLNLDGAKFQYQVEKGRLTFEPVAVKLGKIPATLKGGAGLLDHTIDVGFAFNVATKALGATGLKLPPKASTVEVTAGIKGPYDKPKLALQLGGLDDIVDAVKEEVVDAVKNEASKWIAEAEKQGDALIAQAEKAADALRAQAKTSAAGIRKEAKKQGDKLVKGAKNPIEKAAAEKASDALVKTADKQADKLESEADKQAKSLVSKAKGEKEKLVADARKRTD